MKITNEQLLLDFRRILRHFSKLPTFKARTSPLRTVVLQQYTVGKKETSQHRIEALRSIAHSYANMVTAISELKYLRFLDSGEKLDQRDKIRATAARVGLAVPHFSDERELNSSDDATNSSNAKENSDNSNYQDPKNGISGGAGDVEEVKR